MAPQPTNESVARLALVPSPIALDEATEALAVPAATLWLAGGIGPDKPINVNDVLRQLALLPADTPLHINITSGGGSISEALRIYGLLRALPVPLSAQAISCCGSAAVLIFLGATYRMMNADTGILIHAARQDLAEHEGQTARDFRRRARHLEQVDEQMLDLLCGRTGYSRSFFEEQLQHERPLSPSEALESGIVHEVSGLTPECSVEWADQARRMAAAGLLVSPYFLTSNYRDACRAASAHSEAR